MSAEETLSLVMRTPDAETEAAVLHVHAIAAMTEMDKLVRQMSNRTTPRTGTYCHRSNQADQERIQEFK